MNTNNKRFFLTDKRVFISFYILTIMYASVVLRIINYDLCTEVRMKYFRYVYIAWGAIIAFYDLFTGKLLKPKFKLCFLVTYAVIVSTLFFQPIPINIPQLFQLVSLGICLYMCTSVRAECSEEEFQSFFRFVSYQIIAVITIANIISLIGYIYYLATGNLIPINQVTWVWKTDTEVHSSILLPAGIRFGGIYESSPFAAFNSYITILLTMYFHDQKKIPGWMCFVIVPTAVLSALLSDSRVVTILLCIIAFYFVITLLRKRFGSKKVNRYLLFLILGVVLVVAIYIIPKVISLLQIPAEERFAYLNAMSSSRLQYYVAGFKAFLERPLFGNGWVNSDRLIEDVTQKAVFAPSYHNLFINLLAWSGIAGTVFFTGLLVICFVRIIKKRSDNSAGIGWIRLLVLCVFLQSMLDICIIGEDLHIETPYFWLCLGYLVYKEIKIVPERITPEQIQGN